MVGVLTRGRLAAPGRVRLAAAGAVLAAGAGAWWTGWGAAVPWWAVPLLTAAVTISETAVVHLSFGRQRWTFSLTEAGIAVAFVLRPGAWIVVAVGVGVLLAQLVRGQTRRKVEFNVAQFLAAAALGAGMAHHVGGGIPGGAAGMGVFWLVNNVLVGAAVSAMSGRPLARLLWASAPLSAVHSTGTASLGVLSAWLVVHAPLGLVALVVPLALLWLSYDAQTARAAEARLFAELARLQEQASGRSVDLSAQVVLTAAARLFGGADVEMVLVGEEGPVLYAGDESGILRHRADPAAFDSPWVLRALGSGGVRTGVEDGRPYCSAVLGPTATPAAVLIARRSPKAAGFGRREVMLAGVLVRQAESWLSVAELTASRDEAREQARAAAGAARALGDLGAHTAPALGVLRESTGRLARLAATPTGPDPIGEIVGELHAVERAVASLLGAVALAADPELAGLGVPARSGAHVAGGPPARAGAVPGAASAEWTTTGVLGADG